MTLPTGNESNGLGKGYTVFEPLPCWGQMLGANGFVQLQAGYEIAVRPGRAAPRGVRPHRHWVHVGAGRRLRPRLVADGRGDGRQALGRAAEWDIVPQAQVSLSKLQHVLMNVGVRVPLNERDSAKPQLFTYFLWDWFDGGLFQFWK